jgi:hypothetical protein
VKWQYEFELDWPANCVWETQVSVVRGENAFVCNEDSKMFMPSGFAAIIDAECDLIAIVPDIVGLVQPDRRLPELLAQFLNKACHERPKEEKP